MNNEPELLEDKVADFLMFLDKVNNQIINAPVLNEKGQNLSDEEVGNWISLTFANDPDFQKIEVIGKDIMGLLARFWHASAIFSKYYAMDILDSRYFVNYLKHMLKRAQMVTTDRDLESFIIDLEAIKAAWEHDPRHLASSGNHREELMFIYNKIKPDLGKHTLDDCVNLVSCGRDLIIKRLAEIEEANKPESRLADSIQKDYALRLDGMLKQREQEGVPVTLVDLISIMDNSYLDDRPVTSDGMRFISRVFTYIAALELSPEGNVETSLDTLKKYLAEVI